jgi:hypothetical protein
MISTPGGKVTSNQMVKSVPIQLGSKLIKTDLVLLNLEGIDVILVWQNQPELHRLKYASPLLRAPTYFKRYNPLACWVMSR